MKTEAFLMLTRVRAVSLALLLAGVVPLAAQQASEAAAPFQPTAPAVDTKVDTNVDPPANADPVATRDTTQDATQDAKPEPKTFHVETSTRIPLSMINSVSTKTAAPGDRVYLETVFPILVDGRIVIPPGSYVAGTITKVQRPGKVKGRGEFYLRFDTLTLPNGTTRDFRARVSGLDGRASEELNRSEGSIKSEGNKAGDARTVVEGGIAGASIGALAGSLAGSTAMGAGLGAAAGAAAGLATVLFTRGPDAVLAKGTTIEMVLDRNVEFKEAELDFSNSSPRRSVGEGSGPLPSQKTPGARRWPL